MKCACIWAEDRRLVMCAPCTDKLEMERASRKRVRHKKPADKPCLFCGFVFHAKEASVKYCSDDCRKLVRKQQIVNSATNRKANTDLIDCGVCGVSFNDFGGVMGTRRELCSPRCVVIVQKVLQANDKIPAGIRNAVLNWLEGNSRKAG